MFIRYFIGVILSKKSCQKRRVRKKNKKGGGDDHIGGLSIEGDGGFKHYAHYAWSDDLRRSLELRI